MTQFRPPLLGPELVKLLLSLHWELVSNIDSELLAVVRKPHDRSTGAPEADDGPGLAAQGCTGVGDRDAAITAGELKEDCVARIWGGVKEAGTNRSSSAALARRHHVTDAGTALSGSFRLGSEEEPGPTSESRSPVPQ